MPKSFDKFSLRSDLEGAVNSWRLAKQKQANKAFVGAPTADTVYVVATVCIWLADDSGP